ncbi:MAG: type II toxin-antitoxin system Phd/YefM family antitoxin [Anaerolineae bacterium]
MAIVGVRELNSRISEIMRRVREEGAEYVVTYQGQPVAVLLPIDHELMQEKMQDAAKQAAGVTDKAALRERVGRILEG